MADSKYGRLFTEADVNRLLTKGVELQNLNLDDLVTEIGDELTFPADEPLFLLRGQDACAQGGVAGYIEVLEQWAEPPAGPSCTHIGAVTDALKELRKWQAANPDRVKVPD